MLQRVRLGATETNAADQRWATPWGRLLMLNLITQPQYDAAETYARLLGQMRRIMDARSPWVSAPAWMTGGTRGTVSEEPRTPQEQEDERKRDRSIMKRQQAAWLELAEAGNAVLHPVHKMLREQRDPDLIHLPNIRTGLTRLAVHFGFVKAGR